MRLYNGRLVPLEDFENSDLEREMEDISEGLFSQDDGAMAGDVKITHSFFDILTNRTNLNSLITSPLKPIAIVNLTRIVEVLLVVLLAIATADFIVARIRLKNASSIFALI